MPITETVYPSFDNEIILVVKENNIIVDLVDTEVNRVALKFGEYLVDSALVGSGDGCFDWSTRGDEGIVIVTLGSLELPIKSGSYDANLIVYDPLHLNGQVWPLFNLVFDEGC